MHTGAVRIAVVPAPGGSSRLACCCAESQGEAEDLRQDSVSRDREVFFFCLFRAAPAAYGGSQARDGTGAVAAGLCQSHSNVRAKPHL